MRDRLPILQTIARSLAVAIELRVALWERLAFPLAMSVVLGVTSTWLGDGWAGTLVGAAAVAPISLFAVAWHRAVLLGSPAQGPWVPILEWRHVGYLARFVVWGVGQALSLGVVAGVLYVVVFDDHPGARAVLGAWWFQRPFALLLESLWAPWALILPAFALDRPISIRSALSLSRGNVVRVVVVCGVVPGLVRLTLQLVPRAVGKLPDSVVTEGLQAAVSTMADFGGWVAFLTTLTLTYEFLLEDSDPRRPDTLTQGARSTPHGEQSMPQ